MRALYLVDAGTLYTAMVFITFARFGEQWPTYPVSHYLTGFSVATVTHLLVYYFGGLYERDHSLGSRRWLPRAAGLSGVAVLIDAAMGIALDRYLMPRWNLVILLVASSLVVAFNRWFAHSMIVHRFGRPRVLLVGNPDDTSLAEQHLEVSDRDAVVCHRVTTNAEIIEAVNEHGITDVLITSGYVDDIYPHPLSQLESRRISVYYRLEPADTLLGVRRSHQIAGMPFVILRLHAMPSYKLRLKRLMELAVLAVLSPVILLVVGLLALYVRIVAGAGVFYTQKRVGRNGEHYDIIKFRTMYHGAEKQTGPVKADRTDERVVPWLAWMRQMRMDELPQVWNVVRGEMSIVGPRPERPGFAKSYEELIPGYSRRHDIAPGITGMAQVQGSYHTDPGYKLGHDLQYLVNWSPILDLQLMVRTVWVVLSRQV